MKLIYRKGFSLLPFTLFIVLLSPPVIADSLIGKFNFKKRAPRGVLIYFPEDQSLKRAPTIDQVNQQFTKVFMIGSKGSEASFKNSDTINHNIYADDKKTKVSFDIGLAPPGSETKQKITWDEGQVIIISCKIHPTMRAWVASISSKYYKAIQFKKKQKKAKFEIIDIPDSFSKVAIWIPGYPPINTEIPKGGEKTLDLKKKNKKRGTLTLSRQ